jgi:hypothetical protein
VLSSIPRLAEKSGALLPKSTSWISCRNEIRLSYRRMERGAWSFAFKGTRERRGEVHPFFLNPASITKPAFMSLAPSRFRSTSPRITSVAYCAAYLHQEDTQRTVQP